MLESPAASLEKNATDSNGGICRSPSVILEAVKEGYNMKPRVKNDSWVYTVSRAKAREKVKRLSHKRHRRDDCRVIDKERFL
jgi:hypothetical protein